MLSIPESFFAKLTAAQRLFTFVLVVALSATLVALLVGGWKTGILIGLLVLAILWVTRPLWTPAHHEGNLRVRLTSLAIISSVALAVAGKAPEAKPVLREILEHLGLQHSTAQQVITSDRLVSGLVLAFTLIGIFVVNWFTRDKSAMHKHPRRLDQDFPEQTYQQQLKRYSEILMGRLTTLDDETRWDDYFFAPLEAEVEVISGRRSTKKIVDLMQALQADRTSRVILVLGDPGAGKSIALRKLAKELMKEVDSTGRLPVYINLKEWGDARQWSEDAPATAQELRAFVLQSLKSYSMFADQFLGEYFDRMFDSGRFFFLLDSFDEIPAVLDVSEGSWLIQHLSRLISEFFMSQKAGRGIVASRFYRRPKFSRVESATFEIRPFSDMRIHEALLRSGKLRSDTIDKLFRERTELIPVARNPFSAALIRIYAENHGGELPSNQLQMYESYIRGRLDASVDQTRRYGLIVEQIIVSATEIAWCMFRGEEIGLEAPINQLAELLPNIPMESVTTVLRYSSLARMSGGTDPRFSFVHRRLNEYFVARGLLNNPTGVTLQAIPTDSRYRDALALYCEVGESEHVKNIAAFCWSEITAVRDDSDTLAEGHLRAVHCLRFLRDAFRTRPEVIEFDKELAEYISGRIDSGGDLLAAKIALEATGLLPENETEPILVKALEMGNSWISDTALHACRHLKRVSPKLDRGLFEYLRSIPISEFLHRNREIVFSLSLSDAFRGLRRYCAFRSADNRIFVIAVILITVMSPALGIVMAVLWPLSHFVTPLTRRRSALHFLLMRLYVAAVVLTLGMRSLFVPNENVVWMWWLKPTSLRVTQLILPGLRFAHGSGLTYVAAAYIVVGIAIAPLVDLASTLQRFRWPRAVSLKQLAVIACTIAASIGLIVGITTLIERVSPWITRHKTTMEVVFSFVVAFPILVSVLRFLWLSYVDRRYLNEGTRSTALTRVAIANTFARFRTRWCRKQYVECLRDAQIQPVGNWNVTRPNVDNDEASTLLAQLEERWLAIEA